MQALIRLCTHRFLLPLGMALVLAGCATTQNYQAMLNTWVGATEDQLIQHWGAPNSTYDTKDFKYLTYRSASTEYMPGSPTTWVPTRYGYVPMSGLSGYTYTLNCDTTFQMKNGVVVNWQIKGNDCRL